MSTGSPLLGQLANVSAVLVASEAAREEPGLRATAQLLARLFDDLSITEDVTSGLEGAREERVLVVCAGEDPEAVPAELLLGLSAWPEHDCVAPMAAGRLTPACALLRREAALASAREAALPESSPLETLVARLDTSAIEGDDLAALLDPKPRLS